MDSDGDTIVDSLDYAPEIQQSGQTCQSASTIAVLTRPTQQRFHHPIHWMDTQISSITNFSMKGVLQAQMNLQNIKWYWMKILMLKSLW